MGIIAQSQSKRVQEFRIVVEIMWPPSNDRPARRQREQIAHTTKCMFSNRSPSILAVSKGLCADFVKAVKKQ
ncbi:hypothetical protein DF156_02265 [Burkholderia ubonensis]|uniref:Uncharacterized protein n=1 Tax=Burkholderia ubonensis TaxID=101571 RepID=A0AB74DA85_9BURK|nr:hypothetical protein CJO71_28455 [Burkholderia ubonensis]PAJ88056.1 hypothetical protein CJO70_09705 [Burkholderia ubonensis]PAJ94522.1 hypothetical protein CJO69_11685 [Burkholderia ubonensis]PAJ97595.1 hypothetical protein CJO68_29320 [Burkholderia ubonensis]PAK08264.1 hypothetical protein CJO67_09950 [Burkholderia ubonensis]